MSGTVLLHASDRGHSDRRSLLFSEPLDYIVAMQPADLEPAFAALQNALDKGSHVAGYLTYEAGLALHGIPPHALPAGEPLLCFGVYPEPAAYQPSELPESSASLDHPLELALMPAVAPKSYSAQIAAIQQWIAAGDIYQANYTLPLKSLTRETAANLYRALLQQQPAAFAAALNLAPSHVACPVLLSFSPELFFRTGRDRSIHTQPMKGTVARSLHPGEDERRATWLAADAKNRAEHVMIVDLMRNDLGRICQTGSVLAQNLFTIRNLPTVHQMVSDVQGRLRPEVRWLDVFRALFPSGSVTGAPKLRAMQLLHHVENEPRSAYTGAIGYIAPGGESCFSVAIRTLVLRPANGQQEVTCGVGGGIVADSTPAGEYDEALLKAAFVRRACKPIEIIETLRSDNGNVRWLETHLDRLQRTAEALNFPFQRTAAREQIQQRARQSAAAEPQRIRITLAPSGELRVASQPLGSWPDRMRTRLSAKRTHLGDPALRYKTSFREDYDTESKAAREAGFHEAVFANDAGLVTEGSVTNVYFVRGGRVLTPYIECGVLPGVVRTQLLHGNMVEESILPLAGLADCEALLLGNSLRGVIPVDSLQVGQDSILTWRPEAAEPHLSRLRQFIAAAGL